MSFEIARVAINSVNQSLDVISNNIANANSYGYKSKRANFSAVYAGNMPNGAEVSSITETISTTGGVRNTGGAMDAMITDNGFFAVRDNSGQIQYTRVGMFNVDKDGYVIDATGRKAQGYAAFRDASGQLVPGAALGPLGDLKIQTGQLGAVASTKLGYNGNLSAGWKQLSTATFNMDDPTTFNSSVTSTVYDSKGAKHTLTQYFVKTADDQVAVFNSINGNPPQLELTAPVAGPPPTPGVYAPDTYLTFNGKGQLVHADPSVATIPTPLPDPAVDLIDSKYTYSFTPDGGTNPIALEIDYAGITQYAGDSSTLLNEANGNAAGMLNGTSIAANGSIIATYTNGQSQVVGTLAVATFANPNALKPGANTSWMASVDSGTPLYSTPGSATASTLAVGVLEDSNVDLTGELVNLMSAQRNYQANTKVISAQSEMMQSLMQAI
ncbi:MAG: flagellar hook-basal body complex protein [Comamonadaceae bacterium]|jgi:flagellar hook protein FlgE|nr:flagellar hook-basal body complex protein [Comamonadaceae bacterium]